MQADRGRETTRMTIKTDIDALGLVRYEFSGTFITAARTGLSSRNSVLPPAPGCVVFLHRPNNTLVGIVLAELTDGVLTMWVEDSSALQLMLAQCGDIDPSTGAFEGVPA